MSEFINSIFNSYSIEMLSIIIGVISVIASLISLIGSRVTLNEKIKNTDDNNFDIVMKSDDIHQLGKYLDDIIGDFTIYEYTKNTSVSTKIDNYFDKLIDFVKTENVEIIDPPSKPSFTEKSDIKEPVTITPPPATTVASTKRDKVIVGNIDKEADNFNSQKQRILEELNTGETWNALARLRRIIETELRDIAKNNNIKTYEKNTASQLLYLLIKKDILNYKFNGLRYSIQVSNRAIHGNDVSYEQAMEAIILGLSFISELKEEKN